MNRRSFLTAVTATAAVAACEALPEDMSCDIVTTGRVREECPRPAIWKYAADVTTRMRFCAEHAACCATMLLVPV